MTTHSHGKRDNLPPRSSPDYQAKWSAQDRAKKKKANEQKHREVPISKHNCTGEAQLCANCPYGKWERVEGKKTHKCYCSGSCTYCKAGDLYMHPDLAYKGYIKQRRKVPQMVKVQLGMKVKLKGALQNDVD